MADCREYMRKRLLLFVLKTDLVYRVIFHYGRKKIIWAFWQLYRRSAEAHTHKHTHKHTHIHTHTQTHTYAHTCTHTHTPKDSERRRYLQKLQNHKTVRSCECEKEQST